MDTFDIIFYVFAAVTIVSAFVVVFTKNIMYAAFSLLFTFIGVAALYVLLHADFLAVTQILIYVGGILVLLLFGVMLTNNVVSVDIKTGTLNTIPALVGAAVMAGSLAAVFYMTWSTVVEPATAPTATTRAIGELLMTGYALPFEVASVVLLAALIGAALMARRTRKP
ncbi:MAG: NADH-quinone oxidoreductase subunit J [Ignavibacteriae bacterium]|nr:NADH-quinone oxidoreductase subunit J [Ignavibacteriota bacterium]